VAAVVAAAVLLLAGCGGSAPSAQHPAQLPSQAPSQVPSQPAATTPLTCGKPSAGLLAWTVNALASYPGRFRAATVVRAATTETGDWYVVAADREGAYDNGEPTGSGERVLGLTNSLRGPGDGKHLIPLGVGRVGGKPTVTWHDVRWDGTTLAAGRRAVAKAVTCLDEQRG